MLSAGEISGDAHGAYLVRELKKLDPNIYFFGMGSEKMLAEGVDIKFDLTKRGSIGIFEALPNILPIYIIYRKMVSLMKKEKPNALILIDSQGINMPLAKAAKKMGIKTIYYIAPQEWLWGSPKGVDKVAKNLDLIISIFEKEHTIYKQAGANSVYFGHPLLDIAKASLSRQQAQEKYIGEHKGPVIALCPGSRLQEIKGLLPTLLQAAEKIKARIPDAKFIIPAASTTMIKEIFGLIKDFRPLAIVGSTYDILTASDLAICASGTINLEASILGVPNIMTYKLHPLTYFIGKYFLKIGEKLKFFSMPNIIMDEKIIPELVMDEANPDRIVGEALALLQDQNLRAKTLTKFEALRARLGKGSAISQAAKQILSFVS